MAYPELALRTCDDCEKYEYSDTPDSMASQPVKDKSRKGLPMLRIGKAKTPCYRCPKIPDSIPEAERCREHAVELSEQNWQVWQHYRECRAVGHFPDDPIVRMHAAILWGIEDRHARGEITSRLDRMCALLQAKTLRI